MYFLSWCTVCANSLMAIFGYVSYVLSALFCTLFGVLLAKLIFDKFIKNKSKWLSVVFCVMFIFFGFSLWFCLIPLLYNLSNFIADKVFDIPSLSGDKLPSISEFVMINRNYVMVYLLTIPIFSYFYFLIVSLIRKKNKKNKSKKYISIGVFVICLVVFAILFFFGHEWVIDNMQSFYTCSNVC